MPMLYRDTFILFLKNLKSISPPLGTVNKHVHISFIHILLYNTMHISTSAHVKKPPADIGVSSAGG